MPLNKITNQPTTNFWTENGFIWTKQFNHKGYLPNKYLFKKQFQKIRLEMNIKIVISHNLSLKDEYAD